MLVYPQLETGALSQFPMRKTRRTRTVTNRAADGSTIKLSDPAGVTTEWSLNYTDLSDQEAATLRGFFEAAEGSLNGFTFLDPTGNLLAWSDQLMNAVWQRDPALAVTGGEADPRGGKQAWVAGNSGPAVQAITQTIAAPGACQYCFTVYLHAATPATVRLWAGSDSTSAKVNSEWNRFMLTTSLQADTSSMRFGIEMEALKTIELYGIQVEVQPGASGYKGTGRGGVYEGAHLRDDALAITRTGVNRNSCTVNIIHVNHL
uniref:Uncharacterized protein n=1 Tax=Solibacter usitatus (strain Ellin6076) TaxID=234267 RepID=Q01Z31_SOLUE